MERSSGLLRQQALPHHSVLRPSPVDGRTSTATPSTPDGSPPGWAAPGAPDDLVQGHVTQVWLAVSNDPDATVTGNYWHHQQTHAPAAAVNDPAFHEAMLDQLVQLTGVTLP